MNVRNRKDRDGFVAVVYVHQQSTNENFESWGTDQTWEGTLWSALKEIDNCDRVKEGPCSECLTGFYELNWFMDLFEEEWGLRATFVAGPWLIIYRS